MGSKALLLDASDYFNNTELSDCTIVLREEPDDAADTADMDTAESSPARHDGPCMRLPGHKVILSAYSSLFKTKLARWADNNELELLLPPGQLDVGQLLIQCMYQPQPQLSSCSQQRLMQLLLLADKQDVSRAVFAASSTLSSIKTAQLEWETVIAVYSLPPGCPELPAYKPVYKAAAARLHMELKDLEQAWANPQLQQKLLNLPHAALLALLKDERTCVTTENTVPYTIQKWADQQQQQGQQPSQEQLQQLAAQIRMQQCTLLYISTVMHALPAIGPCFTLPEWMAAAALGQRSCGNAECKHCFISSTANRTSWECRACGYSQDEDSGLVEHAHPAVKKFPAWKLDQRPPSKVKNCIIRWELPLRDVGQNVQQMMGPAATWSKLKSPEVVWGGRSFYLLLCTTNGGHVCLGFALADRIPGAVCSFDVAVTAKAVGGGVVELQNERKHLQAEEAAVSKDVFGMGPVSGGAAAEAKLREMGLVQSDDCLHLIVVLSTPAM